MLKIYYFLTHFLKYILYVLLKFKHELNTKMKRGKEKTREMKRRRLGEVGGLVKSEKEWWEEGKGLG